MTDNKPTGVPIKDVVNMIHNDRETGVCNLPKDLINSELNTAGNMGSKDYVVNGFEHLFFLAGDLVDKKITYEVYMERVRELVNEVYATVQDRQTEIESIITGFGYKKPDWK